MQKIFITKTFQRQHKKFEKCFTERELVLDIKDFIINGLKHGETFLKKYQVHEQEFETIKLRFYARGGTFRYLVGSIDNQDFIPIVIDKKTGRIGRNLSFKVDKKTVKIIDGFFNRVVSDYFSHTSEKPKMTVYEVSQE